MCCKTVREVHVGSCPAQGNEWSCAFKVWTLHPRWARLPKKVHRFSKCLGIGDSDTSLSRGMDQKNQKKSALRNGRMTKELVVCRWDYIASSPCGFQSGKPCRRESGYIKSIVAVLNSTIGESKLSLSLGLRGGTGFYRFHCLGFDRRRTVGRSDHVSHPRRNCPLPKQNRLRAVARRYRARRALLAEWTKGQVADTVQARS